MKIDANIVATVLLTVWADKLLSALLRMSRTVSKLKLAYWNMRDHHLWGQA